MSKLDTITKFRDVLFDDIDTISATEKERAQLLRYRAIFTLKLEKPYISNKAVAEMLMTNFGITSASQAYRDITVTERELGNIRSSEKEWIRYLVYESLKEALTEASESGDTLAKIMAADKLAKYARLDKDDQEPIPYDDIVLAPIEYTSDPRTIGIEMSPDKARSEIERIKKKYIDMPIIKETVNE